MTERASPDIEATLSAALKEIRRLRAELKRARLDEPIAVIGAGCRIPGSVRSTADLSRALAAGTDAITDIPSDRWDVERYFDPNPDAVGTCPVRRGGFIEGVELFDPQKFGISAREAEELDPQHRLLLEVAWETLHDSGRSRESVANTKTGVFVGVSMDDYSQRGINSPDPTRITAYSCLGSARSIAAGRVAYTFDFKGPAMQLDTTCSSSLLTIHLGCRSLNSGECDLVLAGGVNVMLTPSVYIGFWNLRALSPDGVCRAFDARANGYVRGEGCSMVLLKRLSDAVRDKDRILALIKASGANHDGRSNGLTAPNGSAQVELIESVLSKSGLSPEQIGYVEAHGTGTELGDPIELESLARALRCEGRSRPLFVGSLKANFGHLEAAAGATSFLKAVMSVKEGRVFPHINCERPNPRVRWSELALSIPTSVEAWPVESGPRTASVNAFGMSGTNVHVVVQQYEPSPSPLPARDAHGLYIHGGDPEEARHCATEVIRLLEGGEGLAGVASSLNALTPRNAVGRFVVARDRTDAVEQLGALARSNDWIERRMAGEAPCRVAFVFPGQGSQRDGMGLDLLDTAPEFRRHAEACDAVLSSLSLPGCRDLFTGFAHNPRSELTQAALFAFEYALARTLIDYGVQPSLVVGHSLGEIVAASIAGVFPLDVALRLVVVRGQAMQASPGEGAMLAIVDSAARIEGLLPDDCVISAFNGPLHHTVSGPLAAITSLEERCRELGVRCRRLMVAHAFHSKMMTLAAEELARHARRVSHDVPKIQLLSSRTGAAFDASTPAERYWPAQILEPVRFIECVRELRRRNLDCILELGTGASLVPLINDGSAENLLAVAAYGGQGRGWHGLLGALGAVHSRRGVIRWDRVDGPFAERRSPLPRPHFRRKRYWTALPESQQPAARRAAPFPGERAWLHGSRDVAFRLPLSASRHQFVRDHVVHGRIVVPGSTYVSLAAAAADRIGASHATLQDLVFPHALVIEGAERHEVQTWLRAANDESRESVFEVASAAVTDDRPDRALDEAREFEVRARARWRVGEPQDAGRATAAKDERRYAPTPASAEAAERLYSAQEQRGIVLGASYRWVQHVWAEGSSAVALLGVPPAIEPIDGAGWHPGLIDAAFQVLGATIDVGRDRAFIPWRIDVVRLLAKVAPQRMYCRAAARVTGGMLIGDLTLSSESGEILLEIRGLEARAVLAADLSGAVALRGLIWRTELRPVALDASGGEGTIWLCAPGELPEALSAQLSRLGRDVVTIGPASAASPSQAAAIAAWSAELRELARIRRPTHVLFHAKRPASVAASPAQRWTLTAAGGLLQLAGALAGAAIDAPLVVLTERGLDDAHGADPEQSAIAALAATLDAEGLPASGVRRIDIDGEDQSIEACARSLNEAALSDGALVFRAGKPHRRRLLRATPPRSARPLGVRAEGTYLITGGTGGLGSLAAQALVRLGARQLLLVGRRAPDEAMLERLSSLQRQGVAVEIERADLATASGREALRQRLFRPGFSLAGIVHAAGITGDAPAITLSREQLAECFAAKAECADDLVRWAGDLRADFVLLLSSIASVLGSSGQAAYTLANGYLDGLARERGSRVITANLGPWAEVGMAARLPEVHRQRMAARGLRLLEPRRMDELLVTVLQTSASRLIVTDADWSAFTARASEGQRALLRECLPHPTARATSDSEGAPSRASEARAALAQLAGQGLLERKQRAREYVNARMARMLGVDVSTIADDVPLTERGLDSLLAVELHDAFRRDLGVSISMGQIVADPRPDALATAVAFAVDSAGDAEGDLPSVISLRSAGEGAPRLYCVHAVDGDVTSYLELVRVLPVDIDAWGVRSPHLDPAWDGSVEVSDLGASYADRIARHQTSGVIHLVGWSLGGMICTAIARHLTEAGREVGCVVLIDSYAPLNHVDIEQPESLVALARMLGGVLGAKFEVSASEIRDIPARERVPTLLDIAERQGLAPRHPAQARAFRAGVRAMLTAPAKPYSGRADVIAAEHQVPGALSNTSTDWARLLPNMVVRTLPGNHRTIHQGESLHAIAELVGNRVQSRGPSRVASGERE